MRLWNPRRWRDERPAPQPPEPVTEFPWKAKQALVDRLNRAAFAEAVPFDELRAIAKANGAHGPKLEYSLRLGVDYYLASRKRNRPARENRPRLRWVPSLQAWVKPGRVIP